MSKDRRGGKKRIREINDDTRPFSEKMLGHFIPYEVGMVRALHKRLAAGSSSQVSRNAEIESFHVHARNLMEFFTDDKQCAIDAKSFTTKAYRTKGDFIPKNLESKISQQIVHLTHERTDVYEDKLSDDERARTLTCIEKEISRFEKALREEWRPVWQKGLSVMDFDQPQGPAQTYRFGVFGATGPAGPQLSTISSEPVFGATNHIEAISSNERAIDHRARPNCAQTQDDDKLK